MKISMLICGFLLLGATVASAKPAPTASANIPLTPDSLQGHWGVGIERLVLTDGDANALSGTYWLQDKLALDGLLGFYGASNPGGTNASGGPTNNSQSSFIIGAKARYDFVRPTPLLHVQAVGSLTFRGFNYTTTDTGVVTNHGNYSTGLFGGVGVEGFIPGWDSMSVEINGGLEILLSDGGDDAPGDGFQGGSAYSLTSQDSFPFNFALHYYF